jgi:hypothetical protein
MSLKHIAVTSLGVGGAFTAVSLFFLALAGIEPDEGGMQVLYIMFLSGCAVGAISSLFIKPFNIYP